MTDKQNAADSPDPAAQTAAERLAAMEEENRQLQARIEQLEALDRDRQTREDRLAKAQDANARLEAQYGEAAKREALRSAAETLDLDPQTVLTLYGHQFAAQADERGALQIVPNPTETLARKLKEDPLLRWSRRAREDPSQGGQPADSRAEARRVLAELDRDAQAKAQWIARNGQEAYFDLVGKAGLSRRVP